MNSQNYKNVYPKILTFLKILKMHEKNCKSVKKKYFCFIKENMLID